ncbi:MAG: discoidin domain-containing protein [Kiritimatiellae bacterium]|nr:discoidin domain-containing protein [Kiritimatiellia bacterium]
MTNLGSVAGEKLFELNANGKTLEERTVAVAAAPGGARKELQFGVRFAEDGLRKLDIDGGAPVHVLVLDRIEAPLAEHATTDAKMGRHNDAFLIAVKGGDVFESAGHGDDAFGAIFSPEVSGDFSATVRVDAQEATFPYAKAGLMVRNSVMDRSAGYAAMCVTPERGVLFLYDSNGNGILDRPTGLGGKKPTTYPVWLRLEKRSGVVSGLYSSDGRSWKRLASAEVPGVADVQQVGMFASAYNLTRSGRVSFSGFGVAQPVEPVEADRPTSLVGALAPPIDAVAVKVITGTNVKPEQLGENLALHPDVVPTASSGFGNRLMFTPQSAIDGDPGSEWVSRAEGTGAWLELDLGRTVHITHVGYHSRGNMADWVTSFTITTEDGSVQACRMVEKHMKKMQVFDIEDVTTRYLRWDALESVTGNTGIRELAVFGTPVVFD